MARNYKLMQEVELKNILAQLYALDPSLKEYENELINLIVKIENLKPDTKFDINFASSLKAKILEKKTISSLNDKKETFNFNFMNKKIYIAAGSLAFFAILLFVISGTYKNNSGVLVTNLNHKSAGNTITKLSAGAFGTLAATGGQTQVARGADSASGKVMSLGVATTPEMGMGAASLSSAPNVAVSNLVAGAAGKMMIMPQYSFKYVYKGEPVELSETNGDVYRRLKGNRDLSKELAGLIGQTNFSDLDIKSFSNLNMTNLSLIEDKDKGLMINFDFNEDSINISENWQKWQIAERDACGDNQQCWDSFRIKISDIPSDSDAIVQTNNFMAAHKISLENYGAPEVDNAWRDGYETSTDKANYYIPEYVTVIYPLQLNGESVRDQSGNYAGLRVTIDILKNAVSGLNSLTPYRYESSSYELETNFDNIKKIAENGGLNRIYYSSPESDKTETIELGTPTRGYIQTWNYSNGRSEELLVPALIFPITKMPSSQFYYGGKNVIVPLAKDLIKDINNQPMPLFRTLDAPVGGSGSGVMEIAPVSGKAPLVK